MKKIILITMAIAINGMLHAATYYVATTGDDDNTGTAALPWLTIQKGANTAVAGDTIIIKPGNYGYEQIIVANSGTSTLPIVIKAEQPGTVLLNGTGIGSGTGMFMQNKSYIIIEGIKFTDYDSGLTVKYASTYITVRKCIFVENNNFGLLLYGNIDSPSDSHHHIFTENEFYDYTDKQDYGIALYFSEYVKVTNNYVFGKHHQAISCKKKMYNSVISDNTFEGFLYSALYLGQNLDNPGGEGILTCYNLIAERNVFRPAIGYRAKTPIWVANTVGAIVRDNFMEGKADVDGGWGQGIGLGDGSGDGVSYLNASPENIMIYRNVFRNIGGTTNNPAIRLYYDVKNVKVFNNTIVDCATNLGFIAEDTGLFKNNIFYNDIVPMDMIYEGTGQYSVFEYNDIFPGWTGQGATDISVNPQLAGPFTEIVLGTENPVFSPDFTRAEVCRLQSTSPCINAGMFLTTTVGSGTGTTISMVDAKYFTDGFGIVSGDTIRVGSNSPVKIISINYSNNTITVDQNISWNNEDGVGMIFLDSAPDIGAYEYTNPAAIGCEKETINSIVIYPNPAEGTVQLEFNLTEKENVQISIYNLLGKEISTVANGEMSAGTHKLDISDYLREAGVYIIRVKAGNSVSNRKLINFK